jgi:hypothetical protein
MRFCGGIAALRSVMPPLHLNRAAHGVNHARELGKEAVASVFHDPPAVLGNLRIDQLPEMGFEAVGRPLLIRAHQTRVADHIGGEDRGEAADRRHCRAALAEARYLILLFR